MRPDLLVALCAIALICAAPSTSAHSRSHSYSFWALDASPPTVTLRISTADLSRVGIRDPSDRAALHDAARGLTGRLRLRSTAGTCRPGPLRLGAGPNGWQVLHWSLACPDAGPYTIEHDLLRSEAAHHLHFARVRMPDGTLLDQALGTGQRAWSPAAGAGPPVVQPGFTQWFGFGLAHLAGGWDHVAFVLGLLLLSARLSALAWSVTGFTLGHSLTLGLAVFGVVRPNAAAIESLIALSIVLVAAEATWCQVRRPAAFLPLLAAGFVMLALFAPSALPAIVLIGLAAFALCYFGAVRRAADAQPLRWAMTFAFGLFHGFGFAGVLSALEMPRGETARALLGFNLGVEAAQLVIVVVAWPLLVALRRRAPMTAPVLASVVAAVGTYAFVSRAFA